MISAMTNKKALKQLASAFISFPPPSADITVTHHLSDFAQPRRDAGSDLLTTVQRQLDLTKAAMEIITKRQHILQQAISRCEALLSSTSATNGDEGINKRTQSKSAKSGPDDRPCGWEEMLIWDDDRVRRWEGEPEALEGCLFSRRRCERHQGRVEPLQKDRRTYTCSGGKRRWLPLLMSRQDNW